MEVLGDWNDGPRRMRALRFAGARGLSFHGANFLGFIGSHASDSDMSPYSHMTATSPHDIDLYFPLEETETIDEVWRRDVQARAHPSIVASSSRSVTLSDGG